MKTCFAAILYLFVLLGARLATSQPLSGIDHEQNGASLHELWRYDTGG